MKVRHLLSGLVGLWLVTSQAADPDPLAPLDDALQSVASFEYGKDAAPLELVEQIVLATSQQPERRANVETRLVQALNAPGTRDGKEFICRQLFAIGTARSIPVLEALLTDPELSHMARYALGRNADPAASAALQRALRKTSGALQAGILNTLGVRRYAPACADIAKLLRSPQVEVAEAAAAALGNIATAEAAADLEAAQAKAHEPVRTRIDYALLACADQFLGDDPAGALKIFEGFYAPDEPKNLRIAALRGLVVALKDAAMPILLEAVRSPDPQLCAAAIGFSTTFTSPESTKLLAGVLTNLPPPAQELLLTALANRGDKTATPAVVAATKSEHENVRLGAYVALGSLGDVSEVALLLHSAAAGVGREQPAARASLLRMSGAQVDAALLQSLESGEPRMLLEVIRAVAGRKSAGAVSQLLKLARGSDAPVRREAVRALGQLVDEANLSALVELTFEFKEPDELLAVEQAAASAFSRIGTPQKQAAVLLAALPRAPDQAKPVLLQLLGLAATPEALLAIRAALNDPSPTICEAAVRTLADWPNAAPAEELLALVRTTTVTTHKVIALRGYVRMAGLSTDPATMYARGLQLAQRPEDRKLVLSSLGSAEPAKALPLVQEYLKDEQLRPEAALAMIQIADRLRQTDAPRAKAALKSVLTVCREARILQPAREVLNQMEPYEAHILDWLGSGPYQEKDKDAHALFDLPFPPEQPGVANVKWVRLTKGIGTWDINLAEALGDGDDVVAYARTRIWSPTAQEARLELGSDDGIKAWLNGSVVHANNTERGMGPRQDLVKIRLKEGWNELMLKITNRSGGWAFACRLRQPDGSALDGLKWQAE